MKLDNFSLTIGDINKTWVLDTCLARVSGHMTLSSCQRGWSFETRLPFPISPARLSICADVPVRTTPTGITSDELMVDPVVMVTKAAMIS
jgi:hypothetical protein